MSFVLSQGSCEETVVLVSEGSANVSPFGPVVHLRDKPAEPECQTVQQSWKCFGPIMVTNLRIVNSERSVFERLSSEPQV